LKKFKIVNERLHEQWQSSILNKKHQWSNVNFAKVDHDVHHKAEERQIIKESIISLNYDAKVYYGQLLAC